MKSLTVIFCTLLMVAPLLAEDTTELKTKKDKDSYSVGVTIGRNLKKQPIEIDPAIVARGLLDALNGSPTLLTDTEMQEILSDLQSQTMAKINEQTAKAAEKNKKDGDAFLTENKKKEGVVTLPSGLQYKVITPGQGPKPKAADSVVVNYKGTLIDGTEIDSSYKNGEPITFAVGSVIKGWTEGLQLMTVGSKFQFFIPPELAYGERGVENMIGPNATLIFEIELLSIKGVQGQ